jgi:hypothetical protein
VLAKSGAATASPGGKMVPHHPAVAFDGKYKGQEMTRRDGRESIDSIPWFDFQCNDSHDGLLVPKLPHPMQIIDVVAYKIPHAPSVVLHRCVSARKSFSICFLFFSLC